MFFFKQTELQAIIEVYGVALMHRVVPIIQEFNEENKDLHKRIKEKAVNTSDFGVQAELPPLDAAPPHGAPDVAADKAQSAAPDAPLSPSQAATDEAPLSPPPQVPPQARQRRVPNIRIKYGIKSETEGLVK
ncbi:hypothetical protein HNY73_014230 [Argiope bruennichi]|uniref:Uncharacterized protein n=1 Tax=Argiope bruennichi TaxID=94029 RepID=A0A8T0EPQ4_ARGBR|nr:hypothetical protein HNY73_014230 [Argiope bruennichi]